MYCPVIGGFWTNVIRQASYTAGLEAITHSSISNNNCEYFEFYKKILKTTDISAYVTEFDKTRLRRTKLR